MDRILKYLKGRKGITLVWMAIMLAVLLMLAGLAIDIAYMYYVKNQLQVAADAAALAGAAELGGTDPIKPDARQAAWRFACRNRAAGSSVYLVANNPTDCDASLAGVDLNNSNNPNGDIVVGDWNPSRLQTPQDLRFCAYNDTCWDATTMTINAVKARPRRTNETPGMPRVSLFLGQIFSLIGAEWSAMSARAEAIASGGLQTLPIAICINQCSTLTDFNDPNCPGKKFLANPPSTVECAMSGTNIPPASNTNSADLKNFFENPFPIDICDKCVDTSQGQLTNAVLLAIEEALPRFQTQQTIKYVDPDNPGANWAATIFGWRVLVPILQINNLKCTTTCTGDCPGDQQAGCKYDVPEMAEVIITKVDSQGADSCSNCYGKKWKGFTLIGTVPTATPNVTQIECLTCDEANELYGRGVRLVR